MELSTISAGLTSIKNAKDILSFLKNTDSVLDKAILRNKVADLMMELSEIKESLVDAQELAREQQLEISKLKAKLVSENSLIRHRSAYYRADEDGNPQGDPYCQNCWERDRKQIHLGEIDPMFLSKRHCGSCDEMFGGDATPSFD